VAKKIPIINPDLYLEWLTANGTGKGVEVAVIDSGIDASHPMSLERDTAVNL